MKRLSRLTSSKQEHAATLDELAWYKRWAFGRRRERFTEGEGQGHLFELAPPTADKPDDSAISEQDAEVEVKPHRRRKKRQIDWRNCGRSATSTTSPMKKKSAPAVAARWTALAKTSRGNWNWSRPGWKLTSTCGPNMLAAVVRTASPQLRCHHGRFPVASPARLGHRSHRQQAW